MGELLTTGTVTLLVAEAEGWARLHEASTDEMNVAVATLSDVILQAIESNSGVRTVVQGDGFVAAFGRASDAASCALQLQRAPLGPVRLRIALHTGEARARDGDCFGPSLSHAVCLRELAHTGQTVLSGATKELIVDHLPDDAWLLDLGSHQLRDLTRPEQVTQLCHPDLQSRFPPLRSVTTAAVRHLPEQLTSFVGRGAAIGELRRVLTGNQLVTLTGGGGVGKTRLAVEVAARMADKFSDEVWFVDLGPIASASVVPIAVANALGLADQPGCSTLGTLIGHLAARHMLVILDNCEHLLDACAALVAAICGACPGLTILATSRENLGVPGELIWRVPALSPADEAVELFVDRAKASSPDVLFTDDTLPIVAEICRRLDGMPLAIELAAARVRTLTVTEIADGLHDRFRLLTGGARTAAARQQTLRASVEWSHELLSEPEQVVFRRLAVFAGGFDANAARAVSGSNEAERIEVAARLCTLVDKSLVVADTGRAPTRYRLLETIRLYALEKLNDSGEADTVRSRHRDHYLAVAKHLDDTADPGIEERIGRAEVEIDNLRTAFSWSCERGDIEQVLQLTSYLQPLWLTRGRIREGLAWHEAVLDEGSTDTSDVSKTALARGMADKAALLAWIGASGSLDLAERSLALTRECGDLALLARALTACITAAAYNTDVVQQYFAEAIALARALGDQWRLSQILGAWAIAVYAMGDPTAARTVANQGREVADAINDRFTSRRSRWCLGWAQYVLGDPRAAAAQFQRVATESEDAGDALSRAVNLLSSALALAHRGDTCGARAAADAAIADGAKFGAEIRGLGYAALAIASLAAGDVVVADEASQTAWQQLCKKGGTGRSAVRAYLIAEVALARGDLVAARRWSDHAVSATTGFHLMVALTTRARVAIAQGRLDHAQRYVHEALTLGDAVKGYVAMPDTLECVAALSVAASNYWEAARLFGAVQAMRQRMEVVRFKVYDAEYEQSIAMLRNAMNSHDFDKAWVEGAALSIDEAIAYAQRGRGKRKRPSRGWGALTPAERDVVRLVSEGLSNKDIGARLFVSNRTVQSHLTHVYAKLGLTSRIQLAREAACRT